MTKEETAAKELIDKFRNEYKWVETDYNIDLYRDAKQCSLICRAFAENYAKYAEERTELLKIKEAIQKA